MLKYMSRVPAMFCFYICLFRQETAKSGGSLKMKATRQAALF
jgi:hypothetical protein